MPGLDHDSPQPLYEQLATALRDSISSGQLTGRMPSEHSLMQEYEVSRGTVRRAIEILTSEGLVRISRGRGMFVTGEGS